MSRSLAMARWRRYARKLFDIYVERGGNAIELGYPHDLLASDHIRTVTKGALKIEDRN